jgi:hypothetical protein
MHAAVAHNPAVVRFPEKRARKAKADPNALARLQSAIAGMRRQTS